MEGISKGVGYMNLHGLLLRVSTLEPLSGKHPVYPCGLTVPLLFKQPKDIVLQICKWRTNTRRQWKELEENKLSFTREQVGNMWWVHIMESSPAVSNNIVLIEVSSNMDRSQSTVLILKKGKKMLYMQIKQQNRF